VSQIQEAARITLPHVTLRTDKQTSPKPTHGINPIRIEPPPNNKIFIIIISIVIERKNARIPETIADRIEKQKIGVYFGRKNHQATCLSFLLTKV
jgi:hypothetical protein